VLSGGGARGAYEAGVLAGLRDVLGSHAGKAPLFDVLSGASVGAINAAHLAAHADRCDHGIPELLELWTSLRLDTHVRPRLRTFIEWPKRSLTPRRAADTSYASRWGRALLDPEPFERLVSAAIPWKHLHDNVRAGIVQALIVSAFNIVKERTNTFVELAPDAPFVPVPPRDPRRASTTEIITADHILASAALPFVFPARRLGGSYYCDGGLRFNTPIAPAIRSGARRLFVVALRPVRPPPDEEAVEPYPNRIFLLGRILDALLQDPIDYDLQVLERFNHVLDVMTKTVPLSALHRIAMVLEAERGLPYRRLRTLVFRPSVNIGMLALEHLRRHGTGRARFGTRLFLQKAASLGEHVEADLLSFVLFDGGFARTLIELGRRDVVRRAGEVHSFFFDEDAPEKPRTT